MRILTSLFQRTYRNKFVVYIAGGFATSASLFASTFTLHSKTVSRPRCLKFDISQLLNLPLFLGISILFKHVLSIIEYLI